MTVAVIADIVGSRALEDRAAAQRALDETVLRVERDHPLAERPLQPVVGDELQGEYPSLSAAMASLLLIRLALPEDIDCRFGIGIGAIERIPSRVGALAEGPAWWAARAAIEDVHRRQSRTIPSARTWVAAAPDQNDAPVALANAYLLARDHLIGEMTARTRRLSYGRLLGLTQKDLAADEHITQSAVSQALASAGAAALIAGFVQLTQSPA